jgi:hypothetical protein
VLWILGDLVGLPFLAAQLIQMMREDESDAARIDAELDAQQAHPTAQQAPAEASEPTETDADQEPQGSQLWWEADPRITNRFKPS